MIVGKKKLALKTETEDESVQTVSPDGSFFSGIPGLEKWEREKKLLKKGARVQVGSRDSAHRANAMVEYVRGDGTVDGAAPA